MRGIIHRIIDRQASRREVVNLAVLVLCLMIGSAAALLIYAWMAVNHREAVREVELLQHGLGRAQMQIATQTLSGAIWDEAYEKTTRPDTRWVAGVFATYYGSTFDHDVTLIADSARSPLAGTQRGRRLAAAEISNLYGPVVPWVLAAQQEELARRRGQLPPGPAGKGNAAVRTGAVRLGPDIYVLAAATVVPTNGAPRSEGPAPVVVSGAKVDDAWLATLAADTGLPRLRMADDLRPGELAAPLRAADGATVGRIAWRPHRPGWEVLQRAGGWIVGALGLLLAAAAFLFLRIRSLFRGLAAKDRELDLTLRDLTVARDQAQSASTAKSDFIANMSHEIRTPLNGVLGMAQAMSREPLPAAQRARLDVIEQSGGVLLTLLNDLLDMAKIEAAKLDLELGVLEVDELARHAERAFADLAANKDITLTVTVTPEAVGPWRADPGRVRQILHNLLSNAIKFTERGSVRGTFELDAAGRLVLGVADTGPGLPTEKLAQPFARFVQGDASTTRRFGGTGLGLSICEALALLMGGDITVDSVAGQGTTVRVALPLERCEREAATGEADGAEIEGLRVLIAEDNETNRLVITTLLGQMGLCPDVVENGLAAVEAWRADAYDIVLMDIQMPVMDGLEATRRIRAEEHHAGRAPTAIVALTANAMTHHLAEYASAGFNGVAPKPIQLAQLLGAMDAALSNVRDRQAA